MSDCGEAMVASGKPCETDGDDKMSAAAVAVASPRQQRPASGAAGGDSPAPRSGPTLEEALSESSVEVLARPSEEPSPPPVVEALRPSSGGVAVCKSDEPASPRLSSFDDAISFIDKIQRALAEEFDGGPASCGYFPTNPTPTGPANRAEDASHDVPPLPQLQPSPSPPQAPPVVRPVVLRRSERLRAMSRPETVSDVNGLTHEAYGGDLRRSDRLRAIQRRQESSATVAGGNGRRDHRSRRRHRYRKITVHLQRRDAQTAWEVRRHRSRSRSRSVRRHVRFTQSVDKSVSRSARR